MSTIKLIFYLFSFFSRKRKFHLLLIIFSMIFAGLCEALLITSFLYFLNSITNITDILNSGNIFIKNILWEINSENELKVYLAISFIIILILSSLIRLINYKYTYKFSSSIGTEFSYKAFKNKLYQNYSYHFEADSNKFFSLMTIFIDRNVVVIERFLLIISSVFILFSVLISLLVINIKLTLTIFIMILLMYKIMGGLVVKQLNSNSKMEVALDREKIFTIRDGINAIREILINNSQEYFLKSFINSEYKLQEIKAQNKYISIFPKTLLEAFGLTIVSITVLILSINSNNEDGYIPVIGTISLAAIRLLNSIQTIYSSWSSILSSKEAVKEVIKLLKTSEVKIEVSAENKAENYLDFDRIDFRNVSYKYPSARKETIKKLNFSLKKSEKIGIIGKTGVGKSTFIDLFAGLIFPTKGKIILNNIHEQDQNIINAWQKNISYLSQSIYISERPIIENIAYGINNKDIDIEKVRKICKLVLVDEFIDINNKSFFTDSYGDSGDKLSGGEKQRIALARALYKDSKILILDEATSSLDNKTEQIIMKNLMENFKNISIIMVSHKPKTLNSFDKVYNLVNGNFEEILIN